VLAKINSIVLTEFAMEEMPIWVSKFHGNYDVKTSSLTIDVVEGTLSGTGFSNKKHKITLTFDAQQTWLIGEMVDALKKRTSYGFGIEPGPRN
jgi:uncharacterized protein (DUF779 family)